MKKLNPKAAGALRHILTAGGGYLAGSGYIEAENAEALAGAIVTIIGFAWSFFAPEKKR